MSIRTSALNPRNSRLLESPIAKARVRPFAPALDVADEPDDCLSASKGAVTYPGWEEEAA